MLINANECCVGVSVEKLFRDAGVQSSGQIGYDDIIKVLLTPLPDYWDTT